MRISASSLALYWRCPELYRKTYISGEVPKAAPTPGMVVGTAVHAAAEHALRAKMAGEEPGLPELLVVASSAFSRERAKARLSLEDTLAGDSFWAPYISAMDRAVDAYRRLLLPTINPIASELKFEVPWGEDWITGSIDCVDERNGEVVIRDLKVSMSGRTPDAASAENSSQLLIYAVAYEAMTGKIPSVGVLDHYVPSKRPHFTQRETAFRAGPINGMKARIDATIAAIKAGVFPPGDPYFSCNSSRCPVWHGCHMGGGKNEEA